MTDQQPASNNEEQALAETANRLSETLGRQATRIEPRTDAYARLAAKVNESGRRPVTGFRSWLPTPQLAAALTVAVAILVGGIALVSDFTADESVGSASAVIGRESTTTPPSLAPATGATAVDASEASSSSQGEIEGDDEFIGNRGIAVPLAGGIARDDKADAAMAFLSHLGIAPASVTIVEDQAIVRTGFDGASDGPQIAVLELVPVAIDNVDRWIVAEAKSDHVVIETPFAQAEVTGDELVIGGRGTGFEGWVDVAVHAATDGRLLARGGGQGGSLGELAPFSATVAMVGTEQAWVVARSSSGTDEVASAFAAVPISSIGSADSTSYRVVGIDDDDPDEGLNLRAGPGSNFPAIVVLDRGAVVTRRAEVPTRNGTSVWWSVTTGEGAVGWVASQYLGAATMSNETLFAAAADFMAVLSDPARVPNAISGSARLGVTVSAGGERVELAAASLVDPSGWSAPIVALGNRSVAELVNVLGEGGRDFGIDVNGAADSASSLLMSSYLGGLPHTTISYTDSDGATRSIHVVYEAAPTGGPTLVAIIVP